jgi:hypothetical protein
MLISIRSGGHEAVAGRVKTLDDFIKVYDTYCALNIDDGEIVRGPGEDLMQLLLAMHPEWISIAAGIAVQYARNFLTRNLFRRQSIHSLGTQS